MIKYYYPRTVRAITIALTDMFNDIKVVKYDTDGNIIGERDVPITFGPVEKYHQDRLEDHYFDSDNVEHNNRYYLQIPRIALVPNGIVYDPDRATGANEWRYWMKETLELSDSELDNVISDYQPTPYNFNFTVYIKNDSMDYLSQILENILPYFNPTLMLRVKEFSFLNVERDLPVTLDAVGYDFIEDQAAPDTRYVNATMNLTVRGYMYRPFVLSKVIKTINSKYLELPNNNMLEGFMTSGFLASAGNVINTSAVPVDGSYLTSGYVNVDNREYYWFKDVMPQSMSGTDYNNVSVYDSASPGITFIDGVDSISGSL